jgi:hypothetical protein
VFGGGSGTRGYKGSRAPQQQQGQTQQPSSGGGSTSGGSSTGSGTGSLPSGGGTSSDPAQPLKDAGDKVSGTVTNTLTPLQKATAWCQANVSATQLNAIGLNACANAYLDGGATAVNNLIGGLTGAVGGTVGGLLDN